jgi:hypothetical protein
MERTRSGASIIGGYRPRYAAAVSEETGYAEFARYMDRYCGIEGTGSAHSAWADEAVDFAVSRGIFQGGGDGDFGWTKPVTREAAAQVICNIMKRGGV